MITNTIVAGGGSLIELQRNVHQNPILIIKAPIVSSHPVGPSGLILATQRSGRRNFGRHRHILPQMQGLCGVLTRHERVSLVSFNMDVLRGFNKQMRKEP